MFERLKLETENYKGIISDIEYGADVTIYALIPEELADDFSARIFDMSGGKIEVLPMGEAFRPVRIS